MSARLACAAGTVRRSGRAGPDGAFGRDDGRRRAGACAIWCSGGSAPAISALAILVGSGLSALFAPASLVLASATAFLLSEFADLAVYTPLARRRLVAAVVASSLAGLVVDSIVFLWLAFGSLDFLAGQIVGKSWMVLLSIPFVAWLRRRDERLGIEPA